MMMSRCDLCLQSERQRHWSFVCAGGVPPGAEDVKVAQCRMRTQVMVTGVWSSGSEGMWYRGTLEQVDYLTTLAWLKDTARERFTIPAVALSLICGLQVVIDQARWATSVCLRYLE